MKQKNITHLTYKSLEELFQLNKNHYITNIHINYDSK